MKHKLFYGVILLLLTAIPQGAKAYDFSAVAPSGHTLYYNFLNDYSGVEVTCHHFIGTLMYNDADTAYYNLVGAIIIPDSVEYGGIMYCVKGISDGAFVNCAGITGVTFPEHLEYIGTSAFLSCKNLSGWINIHEGVNVGAYAFQACIGITNLIIRNNVNIGEQGFHNCPGIRDIYLEPTVSNIGNGAFFAYYDTIVTIHFNGTLNDWITFGHHRRLHGPGYGGYDYSGIRTIDLYVNASESDYWPFYQHKVTKVELSEDLPYVNDYAFAYLHSIDTLILHDSLPEMGDSIFFGSRIATIICMSPTPPSFNIISRIGHPIHTDGNYYTNVIVPFGSRENYISAWGTSYLRYYTDNIADIELTALVNDSCRGEVQIISSGYDQSANGIEAVISAVANYGYHFDHWSYGGTANPDTIHLTSDSTVIAYFERNQYTVSLHCNDSSTGNVFGGGVHYYLDTAIITAVAAEHYHFLHWVLSDNNPDEPILDEHDTLRIVVRGDTSFTAYFGVNYYSVGADVDSLFHGRVEVYDNNHVTQNTYAYGTGISMTAIPYSGYQFSHWSNGITDNPYTFALVDDVQLTAFFTQSGSISHQHDTVFIHDTTTVIDTVTLTEYITDYDTFYVPIHDTTYIDVHDTTYIDVHDTAYVDVYIHDTTYINVPVHDTTVVTDTIMLTEYVSVHDTTYINVPVHDTTYIMQTDTVTVTQYDTVTNMVYDTINNIIYDTLTLTDTLWLTQIDTIWLHDTIIIHDTIYITQEGLDGVDALNAKVYSSQGQIVVEGANGNMVTLYDVTGRTLISKQDEYTPLHFDAPASGTYLIKIGNHPARKVVVIR